MAEQEVIKHTKKMNRIWNSKSHSFWHKTKEISIEIIIIVFAVTLSIWLHEKSEHSHQQKMVKEFLLGAKRDLENDILEMEDDKESYEVAKLAFNYFTNLKLTGKMNHDSIKYFSNWVYNSSELMPNNGRFEGFKSSGKIGNIENTELQNDIMDFYQENIPVLLTSTSVWVKKQDKLHDLLDKNLKKVSDSTTNISEIFMSVEGHNLCRRLTFITEITERYEYCINKAHKIITEINKEYKM